MAKRSVGNRLSLVVADSKNPEVSVRAGQRLDVVAVKLLSTQRPKKTIGARLCGGTSTCVALVETGDKRR